MSTKKSKIKMTKGDKFSNLTYTGRKENKNRQWLGIFICDCGNSIHARLDRVVKGEINSCSTCANNRKHIAHILKPKLKEDYCYYVIWKNSQKRAISNKIEFTITIQDIKDIYLKQDGKCVYTNTFLELPKNFMVFKNSLLSIDRIDPSKGYSKDNIQLVTKQINFMKYQLNHQEFLDMCKLVVETNL